MKKDVVSELNDINQLLQLTPIFLCTLRGQDFIFEMANEKFIDLVGKRKIIGKPLKEALPELKKQGFVQILNDVCKSATAFVKNEMKVSISSKDNSSVTYYLNIVFQPVQEKDGSVSGIFIHGIDVTDHVNSRRRAEKSEAKFNGLYKSNIIGIHVSTVSGNVFDANDAFLKMIDKTRDELESGKLTLKSLVAKEYEDVEQTQLKKLQKDHFISPYEKEYVRKDGSRTPVLVGRVLFDEEKGHVISFALDITERKALEQRKDEFMSIASHELKTPLTSVKGYTQLLERIINKSGDEKSKQLIDKTNIYINKLSDLISDLLDVSKVQAGKLQLNMQNVDIDSLVKECIENVQLSSTSHTIVIKGKSNLEITADSSRIEQVIQNLLSNAIKYSPKANSVEVNLKKKRNNLEISITDFGVGINKKDQEKLFNRFYRVERTANDFSGLGIGLYLSSEIVKRHNGKILVESTENIGSTFTIVLPIN